MGIRFVHIPPGTRMIGTINSRSAPYERPMREFRLDYALYMSTTEITAGQYRAILPRDPILNEPTQPNKPDNMPAVVDVQQAQQCVERLQEIIDEKYEGRWVCRLPTEAEWEYAARYGRPPGEDWWPQSFDTTRALDLTDHFLLEDYAWFSSNSGGKWHPVARKKPSPLGLYDMFGNVSELCEGVMTGSVDLMLAAGGKGHYGMKSGYDFSRDPHWEIEFWPARGGGRDTREDDCRPSRRSPVGTGNVVGLRMVLLPR